MDMGTLLFFSMAFGAVGMGYFFYGRKQSKIIPLIAGLGLSIFPYFVSDSLFLMIVIGLILVALPWIINV